MPGAATKTEPPPFWSWHTRSWPSTPLSTRRRRPSSTPGSSAAGTPPMPWPRGRTPASISPSIRSMRRSGLWRRLARGGPYLCAPDHHAAQRRHPAAPAGIHGGRGNTVRHGGTGLRSYGRLHHPAQPGARGVRSRIHRQRVLGTSPSICSMGPEGAEPHSPREDPSGWTPCCRAAR